MTKKTKITVVGSGYVGMSLSVLLSQHNEVVVLDVDSKRVDIINNKNSTVLDNEVNNYLAKKDLNLIATTFKEIAYTDASFVVVATPTNYDEQSSKFDTRSVDEVVHDALTINKSALIVIKSTIPVGHTKYLQEKYKTERIIFSPEFLREGQALFDNLYPSRIVVGGFSEKSKEFATLLMNGAKKENIEVLYTNSSEAEAIKLFANTYLAMRISFFNELDSYAFENDLNIESIIMGVCLDERIGDGYNNPSFGYGGYCLPKDTKQLLANYDRVPQNLIEAIVTSNKTRKDFIAKKILELNPKTIGFYKLAMKKGSDNYRSSAIQGIIERVKNLGINIVVYEPGLNENIFSGLEIIKDIENFKKISDVIVTNRKTSLLTDVENKCFSRDLFGIN